MMDMGNSYHRMVAMAEGRYEPIPLVPTGIHALDKSLDGGIPRNKLTVIAARTSHGKTATAVRLACNMALSGRRVTVMWLEDEPQEFDLRAFSVLSGTPYPIVRADFRERRLKPLWGRVPQHRRDLWRQCASTCAMERPTPQRIAERIARDTEAVYILDHLGEIDWGQGPKHEAIGDGLRLIRTAAWEHKCLVIAMAQLNRDWDRRKAASDNPDKVRPCLSDIENSGQIEQVARYCMIAEKVHRSQGDEAVPTGEYRYHIFKPTVSIATCRWHEQTATPDNLEPAVVDPPVAEHWSDDPKDEA